MDKRQEIAIIIGASPASLAAALYLLRETNIHPIILEAKNEVGGISSTKVHKGNYIDLKSCPFVSEHKIVNDLWLSSLRAQGKQSKDDRLLNRSVPLAKAGPDPENSDEVLLTRYKQERLMFDNKLFDWPFTLSSTNQRLLGTNRFRKAYFGYLKTKFSKHVEENYENVLINRYGEPLYTNIYLPMSEKIFGYHPAKQTIDPKIKDFSGLRLRRRLGRFLTGLFQSKKKKAEIRKKETQFYYPKLGAGQMYEAIARQILARGGEIILNARVNKIYLERFHINGVEYIKDGEKQTLRGDYYFSSIALSDFFEFVGPTPLNREAYDIATKLNYRNLIKVGILVNKLAIKNETKLPSIDDNLPDTTIHFSDNVKASSMQIYNNWSPYMVRDFQNTVWLGIHYYVSPDENFWREGDDKIIQFTVKELRKTGLIEHNDEPLTTVVYKEDKAYPVYDQVYTNMPLIRKFTNQVDNLYCIGGSGTHRRLQMDESILSGINAVRSITNPVLYPKNNLWK